MPLIIYRINFSGPALSGAFFNPMEEAKIKGARGKTDLMRKLDPKQQKNLGSLPDLQEMG